MLKLILSHIRPLSLFTVKVYRGFCIFIYGKKYFDIVSLDLTNFFYFFLPKYKNLFFKKNYSHESVKMRGVINVVFSRLMCDVRKAEFTHAVHLTGDLTSSK